MKITLNNIVEEFGNETLTLDELIKQKKFTFKMLITKVNGNVVKTDERINYQINDGDDVLVLHLISGG